MGQQVTTAGAVVVVTSATIPGLRHLETTLSLLGRIPAVAAVVGPPRKRWPRSVQHGGGSLSRALDRGGRLVVVPHDTALAVAGVDSTPLPPLLIDAARAVLKITDPAKKEGP